MDFLICCFFLIFFFFSLCEPKTLCSFIQFLKNKTNPCGHCSSLLPCRGTDSIWSLSCRLGGMSFQGGGDFLQALRTHPFPKKPPSWASSTKGADLALGLSKCPHPFLFLLHPVPWELAQEWREESHPTVGLGVTLFLSVFSSWSTQEPEMSFPKASSNHHFIPSIWELVLIFRPPAKVLGFQPAASAWLVPGKSAC